MSNVAKTKRSGAVTPVKPSPKSLRKSQRIKKRGIFPHNLPTPDVSAASSPANSRPATPVTAMARNRRVATPINAVYTHTTSPGQPTVNWECVSYVVSDQKIHSAYEKPSLAPGTSEATSYGRVVTTTTTTTVTTTIATTEILNPDEQGYLESLERQRAQAEASPEQREHIEQMFKESRLWSSGDKAGHESFHQSHHRSAKPCPEVITTA